MSQREKLLTRIHNNPKRVTFDELDNILQRAGHVRRQPRSGSSHCHQGHPDTHGP